MIAVCDCRVLLNISESVVALTTNQGMNAVPCECLHLEKTVGSEKFYDRYISTPVN